MLLNFNYNLRGQGSASGIKCVLLYHIIWKIITGITDFSNMQERRPFLTWFILGHYRLPGREGDSPSNQQTVEVIARVPGTPNQSLITR